MQYWLHYDISLPVPVLVFPKLIGIIISVCSDYFSEYLTVSITCVPVLSHTTFNCEGGIGVNGSWQMMA